MSYYSFARITIPSSALIFYIKASSRGICPAFFKYKYLDLDDVVDIYLEYYPLNLTQLMKDPSQHDVAKYVIDEAQKLIVKLHGCGILHCDLNEDDILYNPNNQKVKITNFQKSKWIRDIDVTNIEFYENMYDDSIEYAADFGTEIPYILRLELGYLKYLDIILELSKLRFENRLTNPVAPRKNKTKRTKCPCY